MRPAASPRWQVGESSVLGLFAAMKATGRLAPAGHCEWEARQLPRCSLVRETRSHRCCSRLWPSSQPSVAVVAVVCGRRRVEPNPKKATEADAGGLGRSAGGFCSLPMVRGLKNPIVLPVPTA